MPPDETAVRESSRHGGLYSGLRLAELIRGDAGGPNHQTPIVFLTGLTVPEVHHQETWKRIPFSSIVFKPVRPDELFSRLTGLSDNS
jgi:hypothetical protein